MSTKSHDPWRTLYCMSTNLTVAIKRDSMTEICRHTKQRESMTVWFVRYTIQRGSRTVRFGWHTIKCESMTVRFVDVIDSRFIVCRQISQSLTHVFFCMLDKSHSHWLTFYCMSTNLTVIDSVCFVHRQISQSLTHILLYVSQISGHAIKRESRTVKLADIL
jgi:hypothetical protein